MASKSFLPEKDAALLAWSNNFSTLISAGAVSYGLTTTQATAYAALHATYATSLTAVDPPIRNKAAVATKNTARTALKANARMLAKIVEATPTVTNTQKVTLGLTVRSAPAPIPPPALAPILDVVSVIGRTVKVRLHSPTSDRRGKPPGVAVGFVYSFIGATPPSELSAFKFEGTTTRTTFDVVFPSTVAGGSQVWLTAAWANPRTQTGPNCPAVTAYLQGGAAVAA
jgi:hypothetical protein